MFEILFLMNKFILLVQAVMICLGAGLIGSIATSQSVISWYPTLNKSFINPPSWLFAPVWTVLYIMMGFALYYAWRSKKKVDLTWFWVQLGLNVIWSFLFFGLQNPWFAFYEIILLWVAIVLTIVAFWKPVRRSAYLLFPYLAWVSFASILNLSIALIN